MMSPTYTIKNFNLLLDSKDRIYTLQFEDSPPRIKLEQKLLEFGLNSLSLIELVGVVLRINLSEKSLVSTVQNLLKEYGDKTITNQKDPRKLQQALGIPLGKACQLAACFEIGRRLYKSPAQGAVFLRTAKHVFEYLKDMRDLPKEHLRGLYLNSHYQLVHDEVISIGSLTANIVHPREVFRPAIEYSTSAVILAHNHPSGSSKASEADIEVTKQLVEAGKILGITLLDHVIVTKSKFASVPVDYS